MRIGAHMSVAGGVSNAVERALLHGCEALQIFTKNANRWIAPPLDPGQVRRFRQRVDETGIWPVVSHGSYLINLGSAVFRARPRRRTLVILEHTAGQGRTIGHRFEHLAAMIAHLDGSPRVGVCLDTCHLVASGYDIVTPAGYDETFLSFERLVGFDRLRVVHANDSKRPCGSRVDRHEHIGDGCLGLAPFARLLHDRRFAGRPLLIETEKSIGAERPNALVTDPYDVRNLETLRRLRNHPPAVSAESLR